METFGRVLYELVNAFWNWSDELDSALTGVHGGDLIYVLVMMTLVIVAAAIIDCLGKIGHCALGGMMRLKGMLGNSCCRLSVGLICVVMKKNPETRRVIIRYLRGHRHEHDSLSEQLYVALVRQERELGAA